MPKVKRMVSDIFGLGDSQPMTDEEIEAVAPFAAIVRDSAGTIFATVFQKQVEISSVVINTVPGSEIESRLPGDFFLIDASFESAQGQLLPCQTFLERAAFTAAFDLPVPTDPADSSQQVESLQNPAELLVDAINAHLSSMSDGQLTMTQPKVSAVNVQDDWETLLVEVDRQYVELKGTFDVADAGQVEFASYVSLDVARRLAAKESGMDSTGMPLSPWAPRAPGLTPCSGSAPTHSPRRPAALELTSSRASRRSATRWGSASALVRVPRLAMAGRRPVPAGSIQRPCDPPSSHRSASRRRASRSRTSSSCST